jgi:hypothetical protein
LRATSLLLLASGLLSAVPLQAAPQPRPGYAPGGCPWIVPWGQEFVQPARLPSDRVEQKNAAGCLSQNDAIYSSNGCPLRFCLYREVGPLPPADPSVKLQLPTQTPVP